ncbi:DNA methyltransferase [Lactimicrobium massiliense]|uniref:DNA methyltransferase n=1 Tax=Lactimicrobium massiliense TaxID=2161814 RepID=UPI000D54DB07|nr:DNA methyltransferase [Lactimicrobium massiliense]
MEKRKLTKEDIDKVRDIDGFPIGTDEDIIALSDAPYYTACPNPFIGEFIEENGHPYDEKTDDYHREPFASDVSEGKSDAIYTAHSYHTKVPYKAIMRYILHYTEPGDIVFDGFAGSGMTGIAAQMCGQESAVKQLMPKAKVGERLSILSDLSPAAQYITYSYNTKINPYEFHKEASEIIASCEKECGWVYKTRHPIENNSFFKGDLYGEINYVVWSDVFICPHCGKEIVFYKAAYDPVQSKVLDKFKCDNCGAVLEKKECEHAKEYIQSSISSDIKWIGKQVPVLINYTYGGKKYTKIPDAEDLENIEKINSMAIPYWYPKNKMPNGDNTQQPLMSHNLQYVEEFYTKRNLYVLSYLNKAIGSSRVRIAFQAMNPTLSSKLVRYNMGNRGNGPLNGTLYVASLVAESNVIRAFKGKVEDFTKVYASTSSFNGAMCNTASSTSLKNIPNNSIDYIFTDPPFGANINYSELSYIWEAWLKVTTNNSDEAIINKTQQKELSDYQELMTDCFVEFQRILKPGRWMTVEFHNSKNAVWNSIQEGLQRAGFIIADVRTLDKKQGSFKQVTTTTAVKQDLIISAYKPVETFTEEFKLKAGSDEAVWAFVTQHLRNLPVAPDGDHDGKIDIVPERQGYLLYDRMVAWHVMNGVAVPMDANAFYLGLNDHYLMRDGMYFLPDQVNEYDQKRSFMELENVQEAFAIQDERGAIQWLNYELNDPKTYAELQPKYLQELHQLRTEKMPELIDLLNENFLQDEEGKWYIPDIRKAGDVEKLRQKSLLKEFESYLGGKGKLKVFRSEAIRAGFSKLWKEKDYKNIVAIAERLPEATIQEDPNLLMYYDISLSRV